MCLKKRALFLGLTLTRGIFADAAPQEVFYQGEGLSQDKYSAAYNAPAAVRLDPPLASGLNNLFAEASFLYWNATEEGLDIATSASMVQLANSSFATAFTSNGQVISQSFSYQPGFNVGIGASCGEWLLNAEYTWIRQSTHVNKSAPSTDFGTPVWTSNNWFEQHSVAGQDLAATQISSKWHLGMDIGDLNVKRPYYQGRHLTVTPFAGLRALWIRQKLDIAFTEAARTQAFLPPQPIASNNNSNSWAGGPRMGLESSWLFPMGFRLEGDVAASLLATKYTKVSHSEEAASLLITPSRITVSTNDYTSLRTVLEMGLGLGWKTYFCEQKCHVDLFASYDFSAYYNQNMMRKLMDEAVSGSSASAANLYLQGFTFKAAFCF